MNEEKKDQEFLDKIPDWKDLPPHTRTVIRKMSRRRGVLVWNSKNGPYRGKAKDLR